MTDIVTQPDADPLSPLDNAVKDFQATIVEIVIHSRVEFPDFAPADVALNVFNSAVAQLQPMMGTNAIRLAMLSAFEATHDTPMNFVQIGKTKKALEDMADARKAAPKVSAGGIILPPEN